MTAFSKKLTALCLWFFLALAVTSVQAGITPGLLPLFFEPAQDQPGAFIARGHDSQFVIAPDGADFVLRQSGGKLASVHMDFVGAQPFPRISGGSELPGKVNYFSGNDPANWRSGINTYGQVRMDGIYPGVSATFYGNQQRMEYDLNLAAGVSPSTIAIRFAGADKVFVNRQGELEIDIAGSQIFQHRPVAYQMIQGTRHEVQASYHIINGNTVTFAVGDYDRSQPLVIDPVLGFSTFFGGNRGETGYAIALDPSGNILVAGQTFSTVISNAVGANHTVYLATNAFQTNYAGGPYYGSAFVAKFDPSGNNFIYFTYLGGSLDNVALGVDSDASGNAYVTGWTRSLNFPVTNALYGKIGTPAFEGNNYLADAFVSEISPDGSQLIYSTYLGGGGADFANAITVDRSTGTAYVVGATTSTNFPISTNTPVFQSTLRCTNTMLYNANAFVAEIAPNGSSLKYSSFFGGTNFDEATAVTLDSAKNIYVAGFTYSTDFPITNFLAGSQNLNFYTNKVQLSDAFVAEFTPDFGSLTYATFLGGSNNDVATGIAADSSQNAYVVGWTASTNFPVTDASTGYQFSSALQTNTYPFPIMTNAFLAKLSWNSGTMTLSNVYSQTFGGNGVDVANGVALNPSTLDVYIIGSATSTNFPVYAYNVIPTNGTGTGALIGTNSSIDNFGFYSDVVVTALKADLSGLLYSVYLGGSSSDFGNAIAVDSSGNAFITGQTQSTNFPAGKILDTNSTATWPILNGTNDAFLTEIKISPLNLLTVLTNGSGVVSSNMNGANLTNGVTYSMSASPGFGFYFVNWTGNGVFTTTNNTNVIFQMQSGLVLQANFAETTRPVIAITNVVSRQQVSNSDFTVTGIAFDNGVISNVFYNFSNSVTSTGWVPATSTTGNSFINWAAPVTLQPGSNTISVYAVNTGGATNGIPSLTNTVMFKYVSSAQLIVQTNSFGYGTISPDYSQGFLQLGNTYSIRATANAGFVFTNWMGGIGSPTTLLTNGPVVTFQMQSGLVLQPTFFDVGKPGVIITNLAAGQSVSNAYAVMGRSWDNVAVANVFYNLNSAGWVGVVPSGSATNWTTGPLSLNTGANTIAVYAQDTSGNLSPTNTVNFKYVPSAQLTVQTNSFGYGTISPDYSGALLALGQTYSIRATPKAGFVFTNWMGGIGSPSALLTNGLVVTFQMQSGLVLQPTFVDVTKPGVIITNLTAGMLVSNSSSFTAMGRSWDNVAVAQVFYNFDSAGWVGVVPAGSATNWATASLSLNAGTNTISVYAQDTGGNLSPTNTVNFQYVQTTPLTVVTNSFGWGTLSPIYNGTNLQIGRNYSITATALAGFAFTNWTGGTGGPLTFLTNGKAVTFMMEPNLELSANFIDITKPTLSITNLIAGQSVSNAGFTVMGKAGDNVGVANVFYNLNSGGWNPASTGSANGFTNWVADVTLTAGPNTISAYSVDAAGNLSTTNTIAFKYVPSAPLTVQTNAFGYGTMNPSYNGALLQVGKAYSITATPKAGFIFTNWTGGTNTPPLPFLTNGVTVTFLMQSNLVLQANFIDVTKPTLSITNLAANQTVTNPTFTVLGKAGDNVGVVNVFYNFDNAGWASASTGNGFTNWSTVSLVLTLGSNSISAYSMDAAGNLSTTNAFNFKYELPPPIAHALAGGSAPAIVTLSARVTGDSVLVNLPLPAGVDPANITLLYSTSPYSTNWTTLPVTSVKTNGMVEFSLPFNKTNPAAFYRIGQ